MSRDPQDINSYTRGVKEKLSLKSYIKSEPEFELATLGLLDFEAECTFFGPLIENMFVNGNFLTRFPFCPHVLGVVSTS